MPPWVYLPLNTPAFPGRASVRRVFPSTAGRLACQTAPSQCTHRLSLLPGIRRWTPGLHLPFAHLIVRFGCPVLCRADDSSMRRLGVGVRLRPRGSRSDPGSSVPGHQRLFSPIRPTRGHIAISPTMRLIRDAFAVRERLGDPRVVPSFCCTFLPGMPPSMSPGRSEIVFLQSDDSDMAFTKI